MAIGELPPAGSRQRNVGRRFGRITWATRRSIFALLASSLAVATPLHAVVGPSSAPGTLARHVIMVLNRAAHAVGFCSAVVLAEDVVLTAAHCVTQPNDMRFFFRDEAGRPVMGMIAAAAIHPQFRRDAIRTRQRSIDLALLRLAEPLPNRFAATTLAHSGAVEVGDAFRLAGFGLAREGVAATSGTLRVAALAARAPLSSILLWTEDPSGQGAGACTGDSGAPIFPAADDTLVAVATWAAGEGARRCGGLTQAVLIEPQTAWIEAVMNGWKKP